MKIASPKPTERGSALLIVLGFLSFMLISAVSFAVYMRIERQASSNYRHATTARHLLNVGLYRAIDDIDAELRVPSINGTPRSRKFPDWPGRVRASAVPDSAQNGMDARVLSLEALSFIPGIFVNDARRYAVPNDADPGAWCGAKWRKITMPGSVMGGGQVEVGRYAYVCLNVSDMLDVNVCKAAERDSGTNRVSIGHLFANDAKREAFDASLKDLDRRYESLADFYACMYKRNDLTFGSPYLEYLKDGSDTGFDNAENNILVTDSIVKPEPTRADQPCNILSATGQPVPAGALKDMHYPVTIEPLQPEFRTAIEGATAERLPPNAAAGGDLMAAMIADYIDADSIPKRLNMPSTERVPMVSQILVPAFVAPKIVMRTEVLPGPPPKNKNIYSVQLVGDPVAAILDVELVFPFKYQNDRKPHPKFRLLVRAYLKVIKVHEPKKTHSFMEPPTAFVPLTGTAVVPDFWSVDTSDLKNCYNHIKVPLTGNPAKMTVDIIDSEGGVVPGSGFVEHSPFSVALVVFVEVKEDSDFAFVVDSVPQLSPHPGFDNPTDEFLATPKIFFQTVASPPVEKTMTVDVPIPYDWSSLEVPDPRFNYKASNWIKETVDVANNSITPKINKSTLDLLGTDGRDGDIYMAVSDIGALQSPGELSFIVRPFPQNQPGANTDFRNQETVANSEDRQYMFRTIRLYDHGNPADAINCAHDLVYDFFTAKNADGTLTGARVNPLSDLPQVLAAAAAGTPADYYWAGTKLLAGGGGPTPETVRKYAFEKIVGNATWNAFTNGWIKCLVNAKTEAQLNVSLKNNLSDVYGRNDLFGWYSKGDPGRIFDTGGGFSAAGVPANLSTPLHEIDRKMLMTFTQDSFSDRQQLFLYVVRAEATVPTFGSTTDSGVKSLAGGRAVALVWRDPYPEGYGKANDTWLNKGARMWNQGDKPASGGAALVSPWYQHNIDSDKPVRRDGDEDGTFDQRLDGYHQHRILFFKQLDN